MLQSSRFLLSSIFFGIVYSACTLTCTQSVFDALQCTTSCCADVEPPICDCEQPCTEAESLLAKCPETCCMDSGEAVCRCALVTEIVDETDPDNKACVTDPCTDNEYGCSEPDLCSTDPTTMVTSCACPEPDVPLPAGEYEGYTKTKLSADGKTCIPDPCLDYTDMANPVNKCADACQANEYDQPVCACTAADQVVHPTNQFLCAGDLCTSHPTCSGVDCEVVANPDDIMDIAAVCRCPRGERNWPWNSDTCAPDPCHDHCEQTCTENENNEAVCSCNELGGFIVDPDDATKCVCADPDKMPDPAYGRNSCALKDFVCRGLDDPCADPNCHECDTVNGSCSYSGGTYNPALFGLQECSCNPGYTLDPNGVTCHDACDYLNCDEGCVIENGEAKCTCYDEGFVPDPTDRTTCIEDPCNILLNDMGQYRSCANSTSFTGECEISRNPGSFMYSFMEDYVVRCTCEDTHYHKNWYSQECHENLCKTYAKCEQGCSIINDQAVCNCRDGFRLVNRAPYNECEPDPCYSVEKEGPMCHHICREFNNGTTTCECGRHYIKSFEDPTKCIMDPCLISGLLNQCRDGCATTNDEFQTPYCVCDNHWVSDPIHKHKCIQDPCRELNRGGYYSTWAFLDEVQTGYANQTKVPTYWHKTEQGKCVDYCSQFEDKTSLSDCQTNVPGYDGCVAAENIEWLGYQLRGPAMLIGGFNNDTAFNLIRFSFQEELVRERMPAYINHTSITLNCLPNFLKGGKALLNSYYGAPNNTQSYYEYRPTNLVGYAYLIIEKHAFHKDASEGPLNGRYIDGLLRSGWEFVNDHNIKIAINLGRLIDTYVLRRCLDIGFGDLRNRTSSISGRTIRLPFSQSEFRSVMIIVPHSRSTHLKKCSLCLSSLNKCEQVCKSDYNAETGDGSIECECNKPGYIQDPHFPTRCVNVHPCKSKTCAHGCEEFVNPITGNMDARCVCNLRDPPTIGGYINIWADTNPLDYMVDPRDESTCIEDVCATPYERGWVGEKNYVYTVLKRNRPKSGRKNDYNVGYFMTQNADRQCVEMCTLYNKHEQAIYGYQGIVDHSIYGMPKALRKYDEDGNTVLLQHEFNERGIVSGEYKLTRFLDNDEAFYGADWNYKYYCIPRILQRSYYLQKEIVMSPGSGLQFYWRRSSLPNPMIYLLVDTSDNGDYDGGMTTEKLAEHGWQYLEHTNVLLGEKDILHVMKVYRKCPDDNHIETPILTKPWVGTFLIVNMEPDISCPAVIDGTIVDAERFSRVNRTVLTEIGNTITALATTQSLLEDIVQIFTTKVSEYGLDNDIDIASVIENFNSELTSVTDAANESLAEGEVEKTITDILSASEIIGKFVDQLAASVSTGSSIDAIQVRKMILDASNSILGDNTFTSLKNFDLNQFLDLSMGSHAENQYGQEAFHNFMNLTETGIDQDVFNQNNFTMLLNPNNIVSDFASKITGDLAGQFGNVFDFGMSEKTLEELQSTTKDESNLANSFEARTLGEVISMAIAGPEIPVALGGEDFESVFDDTQKELFQQEITKAIGQVPTTEITTSIAMSSDIITAVGNSLSENFGETFDDTQINDASQKISEALIANRWFTNKFEFSDLAEEEDTGETNTADAGADLSGILSNLG